MWSLPICPIAKPLEKGPQQMLTSKSSEVSESLAAIKSGIESMAQSTKDNTALVEREFAELVKQVELRKDALIKQLAEIAADKEQMLSAQAEALSAYQKELAVELAKEQKEMDVDKAARDVSLVTAPKVLLDIDRARLWAQIAEMGDLKNSFPPPAPAVSVENVKAHTCTVRFATGPAKYGGFQAATEHVLEIAFGPKHALADDEKLDFSALKWKELARRENANFVKVKKLKPSTVYYVRVKAKNEFGWSPYCEPVRLETYVLKINTKIMTSDEIQLLIDLIKEKRNKKSVACKLLFRGSDDGFLASTFHLKCDGQANTICVIESNHGNVFGGFTVLPWKSDVGRYHVDEEAFVYIVRKKRKALKKAIMYLQYTSSQHSVVHNKYMGPVFGYGHDIYIRNKCDQVDDNSCRNHTYQCSYAGELAGEEKFKVVNYEVFQLSHPEDQDEQQDEDEQ